MYVIRNITIRNNITNTMTNMVNHTIHHTITCHMNLTTTLYIHRTMAIAIDIIKTINRRVTHNRLPLHVRNNV